MDKIAKFDIGDLVIHKQHGYRAVVVDIDPLFQASGRYNPAMLRQQFATVNPWYRLLVDESNQMTYVEEPWLEKDLQADSINNPQVDSYLVLRKGKYCKYHGGH